MVSVIGGNCGRIGVIGSSPTNGLKSTREAFTFVIFICQIISLIGKEGNVLFNDALNTFYLRLYGVGHIVKDHSDSEKGNPLPSHG